MGYLVFAVVGYGRGRSRKEALAIAKRPMNVPPRFRYERGYRPEALSRETLLLVERGLAGAVGVPGINNGILWLDLEEGAVRVLGHEIVERFPSDDVYMERTPRGGLHIGLVADEEPKLVGVKGLLDIKYAGYVIVWPSRLHIVYRGKEEILSYDKVSGVDIWETASYSRYRSEVKWLIESLQHIAGVGESGPVVAIPGEARLTGVPPEVEQIVAGLSTDQLLMYAQAVFEYIGCGNCTWYYIERLLNREPIFMPNITYPLRVERGLHTVFEVELLGALRLLGASEDQLYDVAERIRYEDHEVETPPERNVRYNVLRGKVCISFKGMCPIMVGNKITGRYVPRGGCATTLARRVSAFIGAHLDIVVSLLREVMKLGGSSGGSEQEDG